MKKPRAPAEAVFRVLLRRLLINICIFFFCSQTSSCRDGRCVMGECGRHERGEYVIKGRRRRNFSSRENLGMYVKKKKRKSTYDRVATERKMDGIVQKKVLRLRKKSSGPNMAKWDFPFLP